ncbi:interferon-induced, double-stranded RNA-activated protein kinase-like [Chenopodium quinoa]|uniref:interferon-induced, double-stranded RNA-activated protein kinase-like n=1 Tax=Chenopodium quinoa TaxID=63459 RepID=UPI000B792C97|nr:interferon-induced, double-stranded RNA-activated protein kinase-like [Chenopodium quinoa]XP_021739662.1 interferon-induced, double-stranded RNA-activated protein kinase-like [Chenopodium quinoa]XP_021739663.1 interferon-induced, double-stranded RNA-activated protein kinase-like [Chenopodium quinoa]XP_021739664.1 interferon-induced, double-stranded RNA-activated protein kinase-like [Chenopodium quinoa]
MEVEELWSMFKQIVSGLDHIHSKKIRHGDLKPSNVFLKGNVVKIGDFGLACSLKEATNFPIARGIYTAPELKSPEKPFTLYSDMFSLGMILLEMLVGFEFGTSQEKFEVLGDPEKRTEYLVKACLDGFKEDIIRSLLEEDFNERPDTSMILELLKEDT